MAKLLMSHTPLSCEYKNVDPLHVADLAMAIRETLEQAAIPKVTTPADILSALFTVLYHMLRASKALQAPEDRAGNAMEINQVLSNMLAEFGTSIIH